MSKGPAWDDLEARGLNQHKADPVEDIVRAHNKIVIVQSTGYEDAKERSASAHVTMIMTLGTLKVDADLGRCRREQLRAFGKERGTDLHDTREAEWERWRKEAARLCQKQPWLKLNKSELARRVKKSLGLSESVRTIRNRL